MAKHRVEYCRNYLGGVIKVSLLSGGNYKTPTEACWPVPAQHSLPPYFFCRVFHSILLGLCATTSVFYGKTLIKKKAGTGNGTRKCWRQWARRKVRLAKVVTPGRGTRSLFSWYLNSDCSNKCTGAVCLCVFENFCLFYPFIKGTSPRNNCFRQIAECW